MELTLEQQYQLEARKMLLRTLELAIKATNELHKLLDERHTYLTEYHKNK